MEGRWKSEREEKKKKKRKRYVGEMRDCMEPKSRPAGPACCLRDCKLSLRMQTDKHDRHHLPILPSAAETVARASPSSFSPSFHSISRRFFLSSSPVHTHVYELPNLFPLSSSSSATVFPSLSLSLFLFFFFLLSLMK